ncbi:MAG: molybdenum cofactor biosynthesis protein MoaE [Archaeoglobales archaeon]|nr:MAG: molybdenum cofactor biosynthesis protein MoaE [Archaeoglobales archaeon]
MKIVGSSKSVAGKVCFVKLDGNLIKTDVATFNTNAVTLEKVLDFLAELGYDYAVIEDFENIGRDSGIKNGVEWESLKSLVEKVKRSKGSERCGAIGIFVGFVRGISRGKKVEKLEYEKYEELYEEKLKEIENKLKSNPGIVEVKIYHRDGVLKPGEDIIYVVVMGEHRKNVWKPLEESMELVKKELPIWKKEVFTDRAIWAHDYER